MLNFNKISHSSSFSSSVSTDMGLREYMSKVYNNMAIALLISGLTAFLTSSSSAMMSAIYSTPLSWVVMFAPLIFVFFFNYKLANISGETARNYLWIFSALMGLSMSSIFVIYTATSIARVFFISSATFGLTALYGYQTKKDLTNLGSFMIMGLIGIIIASLVNIFLKSSALQFAVSVLGVIVFIGLTAYDSQRIKQLYYQVSTSAEMVSKMAVVGALSLYMNFINLFMSLLHLFGERK
jgi:hypothetical protein